MCLIIGDKKLKWPTATRKSIQTKKNSNPCESFLNKFMNIGMTVHEYLNDRVRSGSSFNVFVMIYLTWNCVEGKVSA